MVVVTEIFLLFAVWQVVYLALWLKIALTISLGVSILLVLLNIILDIKKIIKDSNLEKKQLTEKILKEINGLK